jgi:TrmH family RNA methyltransferase
VLLEGVRLVEEGLATHLAVRGAIVSTALEGTPRGAALKVALGEATDRIETVSEPELAALSATEHPQGVIVVAEPLEWSLDAVAVHAGTTILVLDGVQDPGNVGTMLRSALGLGASAVVALPGTAELHNPKTLRAAMGAPFRLPCLATDEATLAAWLSAHRIGLWLGAMDGDPVMGRGDAGPLAIAVGNEGAGVSDSLRARADRRVGIPLAPQAESLNVAVAAAILLWEVTRGG